MLEATTLLKLQDKRNLLAFSGGVDSSALLFLLLEYKISFDIAIVNYGIRKESLLEVEYAQTLAKEHNFICHTFHAKKIEKNFESQAREIRYSFFETLIKEHNYENLLTAHHLGDRFEWMLMQFCKGAGCVEMAGMKVNEKREFYSLIRPTLHLDKQELLKYLHTNSLHYFEDISNSDENIKRNSFRHQHSKPLLQKYLSGIKKSFAYLDEDRELLVSESDISTVDGLSYFKSSNSLRSDIYNIDKYLKSIGFMASKNERELLKRKKSTLLGRKYLIVFDRGYIFVIKNLQQEEMPHSFKEECRLLKIEVKLRPFLFLHPQAFTKIKELLTTV